MNKSLEVQLVAVKQDGYLFGYLDVLLLLLVKENRINVLDKYPNILKLLFKSKFRNILTEEFIKKHKKLYINTMIN